ncbi:hypothetical protein [Haladaptatus sp. DYF46]|uniref:hypothetical protein n=1 Tax=Haladaptatus sp. DYF46 TaxID=2886041 RepID=UPI001E3F11C6|nr:hypothetical protein [Haladaptatus sp. DYF46]
MVEQSTLSLIIQFVGLITPALAILIELLVRFHGGMDELTSERDIPFEIQLLFFSFCTLLLGGMVIGVQFGLMLDNRVTQTATMLIFGSLPFLALTVIIMNVRVSSVADSDSNLFERTMASFRYVSSIVLPLSLTIILYFSPIYYMSYKVDSTLNWWIFHSTIEPSLYFYLIAFALTYKFMYSLWSHGIIPGNNFENIIGQWFVVSFTILVFYLVLTGIVFAIYSGLIVLRIPFFTRTSPISAIPYIWGSIVLLVTVYMEIDPDED